jgi:hypothetical protein
VSASTTQFRLALQALLAGVYGVRFVGGRLEAPQEDKPIGCVWHEGKRMWARDGNEAEVFYRVRLFPLFVVPQGTTTDAPNVEELERQEELLETTLSSVLVSLPASTGHWLMNLTEVNIDHDGQFVEGQLKVYQENLAAAGG